MSSSSEEIEVPPYFLCPITLDIMKDPVTISSGITYDRDSIERWIFLQKNTTCPVTKQPLDSDNPAAELTPNTVVRRLIQSWCTLHAVERVPTPKAPVTKPLLQKLLNDARKPKLQVKSLQRLRSIASHNQTNKRSIELSGAHEFLASLIVQKTNEASDHHHHHHNHNHSSVLDDLFDSKKARDEALSILYALQLSEPGLKALNNDEFVESLTRTMQSGPYDSQAYAIMLLKSMMNVAEPGVLINLKPEFFSESAQILKEQISQKASKAALKVLIATCPWGRNRIKAVKAGAVPVLIELLLDSSSDKRSTEMALMVLDLLCQCAEGRAELLKHGAGLAIVSKKILRVSLAASERAVRVLHSICRFSATPGVLQDMLQTGVATKLCLVLQVDCGSKIKERASDMLKLHARAWRNSQCLPNGLVSAYPS